MAGGVELIAEIEPKNAADFAMCDDIYLRGGYRVVADTTERDAITADRKKIGMQVYVLADGTEYRWTGTTWVDSTPQPLNASLTALGALPGNGIVVQTDTNTFTNRTITAAANQIVVQDGDGVSANPNISLSSAMILPGTLQLGGNMDADEWNINNAGVVDAKSIIGSESITLTNGGVIRGATSGGNTWSLQAYDTNDAVYRSFITFTNAATPAMAISAPVGGQAVMNGVTIGASTAAAGTFTTLTANTSVSSPTVSTTTLSTATLATTGNMTMSSTGDIGITINADTDNVSEADNPFVVLTQDGGAVDAHFRLEGTAGAFTTGTTENAVLIGGTTSFSGINLITNNAVRAIIDTSGRTGLGSGGVFYTADTSRALQVSNASGNSYISINAETTGQAALEFRKANVQKWVLFAPESSNDIRFYDGTATRFTVEQSGSFVLSSSTTVGKQLVQLLQNDADQAFIDYQGTSAANTSNNITTLTAGATIQGFIRIEISGTTRWMPFYTAPTS